ncbi:type I-D CRISPR-associated protein Cas10d/Csc3 [Spirulina sp. CS-785/01]|uniref:type I-D CRISPR-associated protein Cas10d/Csc3 n=1 Tax=Spirulina sp. CS-785/01 TaxID=3021716 RepID=UPI00232E2CD3|nr:type I-D CRISPR-associated protein Cas10d/Csc3 [Spirulina sp. CS-785/01]MDB9316007.1 type I-D CRISPR-associated protein Cas10d/Csc3 [Spirulina sp. CS-785/01]
MSNKSNQKPNSKQLELNFATSSVSEEFNDIDLEALTEDNLGLGIDDDRTVETPQTLLTLKLLREAIYSQNPDDSVMSDFAEYVLPNLLKLAIGVTAKGGQFFEEIDRRRAAERKDPVKRDNAGDQSLNTHLLNGLFPANLIEQRLETLNTTVKRVVKELQRRLAIAGFILHDFEKFNYDNFPTLPEKYKIACRDFDTDIRELSLEEHREIFTLLVPALGLDYFLNPENPEQWQDYLEDLLYIAYNAQRRNDTNLNISEEGLNTQLQGRILNSLADLTCLADRLASIIKHPQDVEAKALQGLIDQLSNGQLKFTYHSIAENRGVLTNVVNNAVMEAHTALNTSEQTYYQPLLYLPTGVIYLTHQDAPPIPTDNLPDQVVTTIKELCRGELKRRQTGFGRDGKGMKYAEYYNQFFDDVGLMEVALDATLRILKSGKKSVAKSRSDNLKKFQEKDVLSEQYDFNFEDDIRIDQLAEFGDVVSRKIWGDRITTIKNERKKNKQLPPPPELDLITEVANFWQLEQYLPQINQIQRINETLKEHKLKGNTGGVPYGWYFLAAKYLEHNPGLENIRETGENLIKFLSSKIENLNAAYNLSDGWEDVREWVKRVVMLPQQPTPEQTQNADIFLQELANYNHAKKPGRGKQLICSLSHSPYTVTEQMESAVLFTPQVYTNKQMLGGSNAKRNISSIAGTEMMLRQILMNQTQAVGKRFEDGKYRYLYLYPTYYFTPETNTFLQKAYFNIFQTRFNTSIRKHFINNDDLVANFDQTQYQTIDTFLIDEDLDQKKDLPEDDPNHKKDRTFKLSYPEDKPLTFYFMALPPGRDPTDTESWVMPAWLAFTFPMILDVKTVVSESPIPPYKDGAEFEETVFLDSAPQAFRVLTGKDRFRLDSILNPWKDDQFIQHPAPLKMLTAAYSIHLDINAKRGKSGYDANWGKLTELATHLETSPLYVFSALKKWTRGKDTESPSIKRIQLYAYDLYPCFDPYVDINQNKQEREMNPKPQSPINHPKRLTELYRAFYRANQRYNPKANAVLKPLDIAADTILKAESTVFQGETLVAVVAAEVFKLMDRVHASTAEGRWVISDREEERQRVLAFARYFVLDVFEGAFKCDRARLAGRQLNLIRDTCEFLYRLEQDKENQASKVQSENNEAKT